MKIELAKTGKTLSRRRITHLMQEESLVSVYTLARFKVHKDVRNEEAIPNLLNRKFNPEVPGKVIVSDLTYVRVGNQ